MIDELHVENVALIHTAELAPSPGLTVLTGETGAGKSALLSSLKLLMGERADASAVRDGADFLEVEARLFLPGGDPDGTVVRRRVEAGGRGRAFIDGHMASARELAGLVGATIDICGQHEHQRLLKPGSHVELLDRWAGDGTEGALAAYREALSAANEAREALEKARDEGRSAEEDLDEASFTLARIDEVSPGEGELERLEEELPRVEHAEGLLRASAAAREVIVADGGVEDGLSGAVSELREAARHDAVLAGMADSLESSLIDIEDVASRLRDYQDRVDFDPEVLDRLQARMARLQGLMRRFGPRMEDVFERREKAERIVQAAQDGGQRIRAAEKALDQAEAALRKAADALDAARGEAAPRLGEAICGQMALLEMGSARMELHFECLDRDAWGPQGPSRVEMLYSPGAGIAPRPLRRIASGGEMSRVTLATRVVLGEADGTETLVFDEVDAGVGGTTAVALAQLLKRLSKTHQVIVVTHLAQVAVVADTHYLVERVEGDVPKTVLSALGDEGRVREIARMLSGDESEVALEHARQMLEAARAL